GAAIASADAEEAVAMGVLAAQQALHFHLVHALGQDEEGLVGFFQKVAVAALAGHLGGGHRFFEVRYDALERRGLSLQPLEFVHHLLRLLLAVPEARRPHLAIKIDQSLEFGIVVKESRGSLQSAPRGRRSLAGGARSAWGMIGGMMN